MRQLDVQLRDTVFNPSLPPDSPKVVHVRKVDATKTLHKVWLYLIGNDLPFVQAVTYRLHPSFPDPVQTVRRSLSNPNCQLIVWTWGLFPIRATIEDRSGGIYELEYTLRFDQDLKQEGIQYVYEDEATRSSSRPQFKGYGHK